MTELLCFGKSWGTAMNAIVAEQVVRLSYVCDPSRSRAFDPCRVLEDLYDGGTPLSMLPWQNGLRMAASDHLVLATASDTDRCLGVIAASERGTEREPFLFLDAAYLPPVARVSLLLQRMLAFAMLRIAGQDTVPNVIAACVQTPCYVSMLRTFGQRFSAASLFPAVPGDIVIDLGMASMARRIVRVVRPGSRCEAANGTFEAASLAYASAGHATAETLVLIDLSTGDEAAILEDARRLYRVRPSREVRRSPATVLVDATVLQPSETSDAKVV